MKTVEHLQLNVSVASKEHAEELPAVHADKRFSVSSIILGKLAAQSFNLGACTKSVTGLALSNSLTSPGNVFQNLLAPYSTCIRPTKCSP